MRIQCLQHVPFEGPAAILDWAEQRDHRLEITHLYQGDVPPPQSEFDRLVVMGGPMGVHDEAEYPWLRTEKRFLRETVDAGKSIVGVCLGAQLLAAVLGARVYPGPRKEIGWFPIRMTGAGAGSDLLGSAPSSVEVFHWHGDTFEIPPGALHLASSTACASQAFLYGGRVLGLQFHVESTPRSVEDIVQNCSDELVPAPYVHSAERLLSASPEMFAQIHRLLFSILDRLPI